MEKQKTAKIVEHDTSGMTAGKLEEMKQEIFFPPKVYVFPFELNYFLIRIILLKMNNKKTNVPGP